MPVNYISLTQGFKNTGVGRHYGLDLGWYSQDKKNQPVYACDDGIVIYNRHQVSGGYVIHIKHNNGYVSEYGHLLKNSQLVLEGHKVKKGQQIARMGNSGLSTANHLHFGIYKGDKINYSKKQNWVNPLDYVNMYDGQVCNAKTEGKIKHTKHAKGIPSEPLLVHNQPNYKSSTVVKDYKIYNGDEVEYYGTENGLAKIDNCKKYYTSNKYIK